MTSDVAVAADACSCWLSSTTLGFAGNANSQWAVQRLVQGSYHKAIGVSASCASIVRQTKDLVVFSKALQHRRATLEE